MTTYLLDTNACIALINGTEANVRRRFLRAVARDSVVLLSSIVAFELWYGVAKSQRKDSNRQRLEAFFAGPLEWTLFDEDRMRLPRDQNRDARRIAGQVSGLVAHEGRFRHLGERRLEPVLMRHDVAGAFGAGELGKLPAF